MKKSLMAVLLVLMTGCGKLTVDNSVVQELDVDRYLGSWYEIARFDHSFERGMEQTKATYTLREDGRIDVLNTGIKNGEPKEAKGKAKLTETPALLRVSFFGPFYADYRVMLLDKDYQYALVGSGSDDYLWILSRTPKLTEEVKALILAEARRRGYDIEKLIWVKHEDDYNPDSIYEYRHAGQVRGYTGKRLYAVVKDLNDLSVCYVDEQGDTVIPYGRYLYCVSDSIAPVGFVSEPGVNGITCINTEGQVMCRALVVDNLTPDYLSEGYFRIVNEEGLIGFADSLGHVAVPPQFKYAYPFQDGKAKVTYTGHKNTPNDEHWEWESDEWFYIDSQGRRSPPSSRFEWKAQMNTL